MTSGLASFQVRFAYGVDPIATSGSGFPASSTDEASRIQHISIRRGHPYRWDPFQPGTMTLTFDEHDFGFDPVANSNLVPMVPVEVQARNSSSTLYTLFRGFIQPRDGFLWHFDGPNGTATVECVDALGWFATRRVGNITGADSYDNVRAGDFIVEMLGLWGPYPAWASQSFDTGQSILGLIDVASMTEGQDLVSVCQKAAQSEGGAFYIRADGTITFDDRAAWFSKSAQNTSQVTFGHAAVPINYARGYDMAYAQTFTSASVRTANNPDITYTYSANTTTYGDQAFPLIDGAWISSGAEADALAQRIVKSSVPTYAPQRITLKPVKNNAALDAVLPRDLRDQITVIVPDVNGYTSYLSHIESIQHDIDFQHNDWTTTFGLSSRDQLLSAQPAPSSLFIMDDATTGKLDNSRQLVF